MGLYDNWVSEWTSGMNQGQKETEYNTALDWLRKNMSGFVEANTSDPSAIYRRYVEATTNPTDPRWGTIPRTAEEQKYQDVLGMVRKYSPSTLESGKTPQELMDFGNRISNYYNDLSKNWNLGYTGQTADQAVQEWVDEQNYWDKENKRAASLWDADALRALQATYNPDQNVRKQAVEYLNRKMGTSNWNYIAPHVMETGGLLGEDLPDFLKQHYDRYAGMKTEGESAQKRQQEAVDQFGREKYYTLLRQTYDPAVEVRRAAVDELERAFGKDYQLYADSSWQNPFAGRRKSFTDMVREALAGNRTSDTGGTSTASGTGSTGSTGSTGFTGSSGGYGTGLVNTTGEFNQPGTDWINFLLRLAGLT